MVGPFSPHISLLFSSKSWQNEVCHAWLHCQKVFAFLWQSTYTLCDTSFNFLKYPKGERKMILLLTFPKGLYKNILWRKKIQTSAYGTLWFSNFLEWTQMEFMTLLHRLYSLLVFYDTRGCDCELEKGTKKKILFFCECQADKLRVFLKLLPFQ